MTYRATFFQKGQLREITRSFTLHAKFMDDIGRIRSLLRLITGVPVPSGLIKDSLFELLPVYKPLAWLLVDSTAELPLVLFLSSVYSSLHNNGVHDLGFNGCLVQLMPHARHGTEVGALGVKEWHQ